MNDDDTDLEMKALIDAELAHVAESLDGVVSDELIAEIQLMTEVALLCDPYARQLLRQMKSDPIVDSSGEVNVRHFPGKPADASAEPEPPGGVPAKPKAGGAA